MDEFLCELMPEKENNLDSKIFKLDIFIFVMFNE